MNTGYISYLMGRNIRKDQALKIKNNKNDGKKCQEKK